MTSPDDAATRALVEQGVEILREYLGTPETHYLKRLAPIIVALRGRHRLDDGRQDWSGRSPDYRRVISEMYAEAGVPKEKLDTVQAALRYHVGNLLREQAGEGELAAVGLTSVSPKERLQRNRDALNAQRELAAPRQDAARLSAYAQVLLDYIDESVLGELPPERLVATRLALEALQSRSAQLLVRVADAAGRSSRPATRAGGRHRRGATGVSTP